MRTTSPEEWSIVPRYSDIRSDGFVEAICAHGVGHHRGVHGCDGCCSDWPDEIANQTTNEEDEDEEATEYIQEKEDDTE